MSNSNRSNLKAIQKMQAGMQIATYLEKSGVDFWRLAREIENSKIFKKLHDVRVNDSSDRLIKVSTLKRYLAPIHREKVPNLDKFNLEMLFQGYGKNIYKRVNDMGKDKFVYYFLERQGTDAELCQLLNLSREEITSFRSEFNYQAQFNCRYIQSDNDESVVEKRSRWEIAAEVIADNKSVKVIFPYQTPRYLIDKKKIYSMITSGVLSAEEVREFYKLRRHLDGINLRVELLEKVIRAAVKRQGEFLRSGDKQNLKVFEVSKLSKKIEVDSSWISRIIQDKLIKVGKKIIKLRDLFITQRQLAKQKGENLLKLVLKRQDERLKAGFIRRTYSDEEVRQQLLNQYNFKISRRTINNWRKEIKREEIEN